MQRINANYKLSLTVPGIAGESINSLMEIYLKSLRMLLILFEKRNHNTRSREGQVFTHLACPIDKRHTIDMMCIITIIFIAKAHQSYYTLYSLNVQYI